MKIVTENGVVELGSFEIIHQSSDLVDKVNSFLSFNNCGGGESGSWMFGFRQGRRDAAVLGMMISYLLSLSSNIIFFQSFYFPFLKVFDEKLFYISREIMYHMIDYIKLKCNCIMCEN